MTVLVKKPKTITGTLQPGGAPKMVQPNFPRFGGAGPSMGQIPEFPRFGGAGPSMGQIPQPGGLTPGVPKPEMPRTGGAGPSMGGVFTQPGFPSGQAPSFPPNADKTGGGAVFTQPGFPSGGPINGGMIRLDPRETDGTFNSSPVGGGFTQPGFPSGRPPHGDVFTQPGFPSGPPMEGGAFTRPGFPSGQGPQFPPNPDKLAGVIQKPAPPTVGTKSQPHNAGKANPAVMQKFVQAAMQQGHNPKTILSFLSGRMGK